MKKLIVNRARCKKCGQILTSNRNNSYQMCPCGNFVSGGKKMKIWGGANRNDLEDLCVYKEGSEKTVDKKESK